MQTAELVKVRKIIHRQPDKDYVGFNRHGELKVIYRAPRPNQSSIRRDAGDSAQHVDSLPSRDIHVRNVAHAKTFSFNTMVTSLLEDVQGDVLPKTERTLSERGREGFGEGHKFAPLAYEVADAELCELGLKDIIALDLDTKKDVIAILRPELKPGEEHALTTEDILGRRRVKGYQWIDSPPNGIKEKLKLAKRKTERALDALLKDNQRLAYLHTDASSLNPSDLSQMRMLGLLFGSYAFDWRRGYEFSTVVVAACNNMEKMFARRPEGESMRVPRSIQEARPIVNRTIITLQRNGQAVTAETVAELSGINVKLVERVLEHEDKRGKNVALDQQLSRQVDGDTLLELLSGDSPDISEGVVNKIALTNGLRRLNAQMRRVIILKFYEGLTNREIAAELGVRDRDTVTRWLNSALALLQSEFVVIE